MTAPRNILVFVETSGGAVQSVSLEALTVARELAAVTGGDVEAIVLGVDANPLADALAAADRILSVNDSRLKPYVPEAYLVALESLSRQREPAAIVLAYTTPALDLAPALAYHTRRPLIAYCTKLAADEVSVEAESQLYGGKLRARSKAKFPAVLTIMPGAYPEASGEGRTAPPIETIVVSGLDSLRTSLVEAHSPAVGDFDLTLADKIVCVGRGIGDKNGIGGARELANALGAEIAGSRPVIDNGWLPKERQVGKSGRKVKPKLYFALGVSGAPEHLEGMRGADLIIAVNTDAAAPIFEVAHYGAAVDMFELLPALGDRVKFDGPR